MINPKRDHNPVWLVHDKQTFVNFTFFLQSNQFKPGEERTRTRSTQRRENFETKKVDLSEMMDWEKGHIDRKRKRNREKLGLPAEDYENNNLSSVGEKTKSHEEDQKRRQEAYER